MLKCVWGGGRGGQWICLCEVGKITMFVLGHVEKVQKRVKMHIHTQQTLVT